MVSVRGAAVRDSARCQLQVGLLLMPCRRLRIFGSPLPIFSREKTSSAAGTGLWVF
jgi:hypothetical protein